MATDLTSSSSAILNENGLNTAPTSSVQAANSDPYGLSAISPSTSASSSAQALAAGGPNLQVITPNAELVQNRMVFSTVNEEVRAPKTLTLRNTGDAPLTINLSLDDSQEKVNAVRLVDHQRAADFKILGGSSFTLAPNETRNASVQFAPQRVAERSFSKTNPHTLNGENYAALTITSNDPDQPKAKVNLAGLNSADYEGNFEPAVAEIARTFGWGINIGTENNKLGGSKTLLGDEVYSPYWERADASKPVELWQVGVYSGRYDFNHDSIRFTSKGSTAPNGPADGTLLYALAGRDNDDNVPGSNDVSGGENQKLLPKILVNGKSVDPTSGAVDFNPTGAFTLNRGGNYIDDNLNGPDKVHNWRMYPVRDANGTLIPDTWLATSDAGLNVNKNFDNQDQVYLMKNAKPENPALDPSVGGLFPGSPDLQFYFRNSEPGNLKDKDGQTIGFTSTQLNKNDGYTSTASYDPSKLDLDTSGSGVLRVTSTAGSNGGDDNTLINALRTTFDGRASKSIISTKLLGPLNNINAGYEQAGVMFGPDGDNYIKVVATGQKGGSLEFYFENQGKRTPISLTKPNFSFSNLQSLELMLLTNPRIGTVQAAYRAISSSGDTGMVELPGTVQLKGGQLGHFFAPQSKAGIITSNKGGSPFTATFDSFIIKSGATTAGLTPLYRLDVGNTPTDPSVNGWSPDTTAQFSPVNADPERAVGTPEIGNTTLDPIYHTYRAKIGNGKVPLESRVLTYNLPVTPGNVDINLHFAEVYFGAPGRAAGGIGSRVFDITVEGKKMFDNFDITAAAGGALKAAVVPIEGVKVNDGNLTIQLKAEKDFGAIAGIEVFRS